MSYLTERLSLDLPKYDYVSNFLNYLIRNKYFLQSWEPNRGDDYYTETNIYAIMSQQIVDITNKKGLYFYIFRQNEEKIIGTISFTNIVYGYFQSCFLGYRLDEIEVNKGYMTEALAKGISVCFNELKLHRIEANVQPHNIPSKKVLEKIGFLNEGISKKYLKINGKWEDHEHYALLNDFLEESKG